MIDSGGASHSFVSPEIAIALCLKITQITAKNIKLGDGHEDLTKQALTTLVSHCFVANRATCRFGCQQIDYLGHNISGEEWSVNTKKKQSVLWSGL